MFDLWLINHNLLIILLMDCEAEFMPDKQLSCIQIKKKRQDMFVKHEHVPQWRSRSQVKFFFCMSGKPLSQGTYMSNMKALSEMFKKLWPMLIFFFKVGHWWRWRSRSQVRFFLCEWEALITMNLHAKFEDYIWKDSKLMTNVKEQTNQQSDRAKTICPAIATGDIKRKKDRDYIVFTVVCDSCLYMYMYMYVIV